MAWGISQLFNLTVGPSERAEELAPIVQTKQNKTKLKKKKQTGKKTEKKKGTEGLRNQKLKWKAGIPTMDSL